MEKGRGGRGSIARARFRWQSTHLDGVQRPLFTGWWNIDTWIQSARPKSGCELGHCQASGGPAGAPSGPKAAADAGHMEAAS